MNNEPVAWMGIRRHGETRISVEKLNNDDIPLYTHPVKEQDESFDRTASHMAGEYVSYKPELTDEEIKTLKEIIRITDRKHDLWDKAKEFLK